MLRIGLFKKKTRFWGSCCGYHNHAERCPRMGTFVFVALFVVAQWPLQRASRQLVARPRATVPRRPATTASDVNLRSFVTLPLGTRLQISAPTAGEYWPAWRAKNSKNRVLNFGRYNGWGDFFITGGFFFRDSIPQAATLT